MFSLGSLAGVLRIVRAIQDENLAQESSSSGDCRLKYSFKAGTEKEVELTSMMK